MTDDSFALILNWVNNMPRETTDEPFEFQVAKDLLESIPRIMARIRTEMRAMAKPQLTIPQLRILAKLNQSESSISEMAEWQGVSAPAMSKMVGILEGRGFARRVTKTNDRRQVTVSLTDEGRRTFLSIRKAVRGKMAERIRTLPDSKKQLISDAIKVLEQII